MNAGNAKKGYRLNSKELTVFVQLQTVVRSSAKDRNLGIGSSSSTLQFTNGLKG